MHAHAATNAPPTRAVEDGLVLGCARCGAPQQVALSPRARACRHCGAPEPLAPALRARVSAVSRVLSSGHGRKLPAELARRAGDLGPMALAFVGGGWLVGGGLALAWIVADLPAGTGLAAFVVSGRAPGLDPLDVTALWWMAFVLLVLAAATPLWVWGGQLTLLLALRSLRALPPLVVGGAARCHLCGDDLPAEGIVRACRSCKAHNLVDGAHFRSARKTFEEAVAAAERTARDDIGRRAERIENGILVAAGMPFVLLVVVPVSLALDGPHPELLGLPVVLAVVALALRVAVMVARPRRP